SEFFWALEPVNKDIIKTQTGYSQFSGNNGKWSSGLTSVSYLLSYQIKISKIDTVVFSGTSLIPENTPITLSTGWNYIGYIPDFTMDVSEAMRMYSPQESDIVKSQDAFAMYDSRTGWLGTLDVMKPGEGYMLKVNGAPRTLRYPNSTLLKSSGINRLVSAPPGWNINPVEYENNLSVIARLDFSKMPEVELNNQMVVGAFIGDKCHGYSSALGSDELGYDPFFLNVSNNTQGEMIQFRVYDGMTGKVYTTQQIQPFVMNGVFGTTREPLVLTLQGLMTGMGENWNNKYFQCYPNPFNHQVNIEFSSSANDVSVDVISITGTLIRNLYKGTPNSGIHNLVWDGTNEAGNDVVAGIYYIRLISDRNVETAKITRVK
ncbi:MAG TPA: FlgD immunoglobulin-like domain containing protein, partial [Prolixibacteraceae bacterium]|nr:FlgD immunoglobulin-like domain containing protein [Prolixibacteraceae bacterium]